MKFLLDSCISSFAVEDLKDSPHSTIIRLVDIPAKEQGKFLLRLIETHKNDIEKTALITVERFRVRVRTED